MAAGLGDSFHHQVPRALSGAPVLLQSLCYCWKKVELPSVPAGSACDHPFAPSSLFLAICYCGSHWSEMSKLFFTLSTVSIQIPLQDDIPLLWFPPLSGPGRLVLLQMSFRKARMELGVVRSFCSSCSGGSCSGGRFGLL